MSEKCPKNCPKNVQKFFAYLVDAFVWWPCPMLAPVLGSVDVGDAPEQFKSSNLVGQTKLLSQRVSKS